MPGDIGFSQLTVRNNYKAKKRILAWMTGNFIRIEFTDFNVPKMKF